jgi:probable rRNA maturation factor
VDDPVNRFELIDECDVDGGPLLVEGRVIDGRRWADLGAAAVAACAVTEPWTATLRLVAPAAMAELNREYLGGDGPTDVLSFPIDGVEAAADQAPRSAGAPPWMLGDLVVCPEVAAANAPDHAGTADDEMALLVVHGVLHLLGMDHATDDERLAMQARERDLLATLYGPLSRDPWVGDPS